MAANLSDLITAFLFALLHEEDREAFENLLRDVREA